MKVELMVVAVDERDPGALMPGVAPVGFIEDPLDHGGGVLDDAGDQPLVASGRSGCTLVPLVGAGHDVGGDARCGDGVVDAADLGHALAVALLALREPSCQLGSGLDGGLGRGRTERVGAHDDALAVTGEHEQILVGTRRRTTPLLVEAVEVGRGMQGERLQLALAQLLPGGALDRHPRVVERAPRALDGDQPAQPVRIELVGQVQHGVGRVQVGAAAPAVGETGDRHLTEHRVQPTMVAGLDAASGHPVGTDDRFQTRLPERAQVKRVLVHLSLQLAAPGIQPLLQLAVGHAGGLPLQAVQRRLEQGTRGCERGRVLIVAADGGRKRVEYRGQDSASGGLVATTAPTGALPLPLRRLPASLHTLSRPSMSLQRSRTRSILPETWTTTRSGSSRSE